jgi:hypothetical protein
MSANQFDPSSYTPSISAPELVSVNVTEINESKPIRYVCRCSIYESLREVYTTFPEVIFDFDLDHQFTGRCSGKHVAKKRYELVPQISSTHHENGVHV